MVFGWRKAFCTSVPKEPDSNISTTPKSGSRFSFFSTPSTPQLVQSNTTTDSTPSLRCRTTTTTTIESKSVPVSPKFQCKTSNNSLKLFQWSSTPTSPRSPSTFSLIKSNLRFSTNRCGLCLQSTKRGRGVAIFTAECSHSFHFPCIAAHVTKNRNLACPICGDLWKQMPLLSLNNENAVEKAPNDDDNKNNFKLKKQKSDLKVYNDDEPLAFLTPKARFKPIPESDENCDGDSIASDFHYNNNSIDNVRDVHVQLLPEVAVISSGRSCETYAVVLRTKAPAKTQNRAPIDLVTVVDVSGKISTKKLQTAMKTIISSLSSSDRLSIVAFSSYSKRLLPLKRMTLTGQRAARRIVEAMVVLQGTSNSNDAVKKAAKVLEDRKEKNAVASIILLSDHSSSSRDFGVHTLNLTAIDDHAFEKTFKGLLHVAVQDLRLKLGFIYDSAPAEIAGAYSYLPRPVSLGSGTVRIGELYPDEEREILIELKEPSTAVVAHRVLSVRCSYRESVTQKVVYKQHALVVPRVNTVRSSSISIQRLRNLFVTTRALAESRRLTGRNDLIGAYHMLISARALMHQTSSACSEFVVSLEAELKELQNRRQAQSGRVENAAYVDDKGEPLTPTSAWRVAEKLAKVAIMKKSLNRVSDLHGFEDARF